MLADFTVAVNSRKGGSNEATFFRCTAWEKKADPIINYLHKGDKVAVVGPVSMRTYQNANGETRGSLEVTVEECEFLETHRSEEKQDKNSGMTRVETDLPW